MPGPTEPALALFDFRAALLSVLLFREDSLADFLCRLRRRGRGRGRVFHHRGSGPGVIVPPAVFEVTVSMQKYYREECSDGADDKNQASPLSLAHGLICSFGTLLPILFEYIESPLP